ncbi:hypothetical protein AAHE18_17G040700 [Arachis hypogaea]
MKESLSWPEKGGREGRDGGAVHHRRVCCFGLAQPHTPFILVSESVPFSPILTPFVKLIGIGAVMERLELLMLQLHLRCSRGSCCHCLGYIEFFLRYSDIILPDRVYITLISSRYNIIN